MSGIYAIVGPSGVGKDTLMEAVAARLPSVRLVRRVITRPQAAGGEDFEGVSEAEFARRLARGDFAVTWQAHGLSYGIPASVRDRHAAGETLLFNGSRAALPAAQTAFPDLTVIHVTARPDVLAERLAGRGRETREEIVERLSRAEISLPDGFKLFELDNSGSLEDAIDRLEALLQPVRA